MERPADAPFSPDTQTQCEQVAQLLGPVLENRKQEERPILLKLSASLRNASARLFGRRRLPAKVAVILTAVMVIGLSQAKTLLRITCDAALEAQVSQVVVAPQQGFIAQAHARAGDRVAKGDLLATMDDQALLFERRKWQSQFTQYTKEYRKALSGSDRAQVAILNAKRAQADAQLKLIEQQLARIKLHSPLSGLIVLGDLSQDIGAPVARGQRLFEVALTDQYRVVLKVDDTDIGLIAKGQQGRLKLSGMPEKSIPITIERLTPVSSIENGKNFFRVEARMAEHSDLMRPGMKGIAKIETRKEKMIWILTRPLASWLRLFTWQQLPWTHR